MSATFALDGDDDTSLKKQQNEKIWDRKKKKYVSKNGEGKNRLVH